MTLIVAGAIFYVMPMYVLLFMTGMKSFDEASAWRRMWQLPRGANFGSFGERVGPISRRTS